MSFNNTLSEGREILRPQLIPRNSTAHKYHHGHAMLVSGPKFSTGAIRLSAVAALGVGAGLVTILGDSDALAEHASHVTAIMLRLSDRIFSNIDGRVRALAIGPGAGVGIDTANAVISLLEKQRPTVIDADGLMSFAGDRERLFSNLKCNVVLTPHTGEFSRLFADIPIENHVNAALNAAELSNAIIVLKGKETIIACPSGEFAINRHASPYLATAGSGDFLTGLITGLLAQGMPPFDASCVAVWLHGDIGMLAGPGLTADRMVDYLHVAIKGCLNE